ncbi:glutathione-disulfide reductase [Teredinibacter purpureus]|uniref:glutathione-disulfide reductase n=1 Tax=Teredinibacter purpureus TaxID=2731756 RepID=UPI0005F7BF92|nr:glutathione-disulfide reductase [Teredinibacter purpureus]
MSETPSSSLITDVNDTAFDYDFFVIGAGSGGVRASRIASQLGARVAVAEELYLGGTCVNVGCVPKKLFVYASQFREDFDASKGFGWGHGELSFNWQTLRDNKTTEIKRLNGVYNNILSGANVEILHGRATLAGKNSVSVNGTNYKVKHILIATGSWPRKPTYQGAEYTIDSNEFFYLETLPQKVIVEGGGYIAVEFAGILNSLGCDTELVYRGELFLRNFDNSIRHFVAEEIRKKGIKLSFKQQISSVQKNNDGSLTVNIKNSAQNEEDRNVTVDAVVTAIGRTPKTGNLGLEALGVAQKTDGSIIVDNNFTTNVEGVYALGDVIGRKQLTPVALSEGMALARHLFDGQPINMDYDNIATAVFCQPNIGTVGLTEEEALERGYTLDIYKSEFKAMKHTLSGLDERTLMKLIVDKNTDKILGAHMVGPDAGEIMQGLAIAIKAGATKAHFDSTIGIHPTAAEEFVTMREPVG